ncbi:MAG: phospho-N-acetylmuramoyl-pentapeptide-transferase [Dehalococcoidia bacterium]|nr:phospho-N-acetylmuramoyl-pentapeptide-transferase [Dehalococcoidia bacterium]
MARDGAGDGDRGAHRPRQRRREAGERVTYSLIVGTVAFLFAAIVGRPIVAWLSARKLGKVISTEGPESHNVKAGTPTMGGLIIFATVIAITPFTNLIGRQSILLPLAAVAGAGLIGLWDDFGSLQGRPQGGLSWRLKFGLIGAGALLAGFVLKEGMEISNANVPWLGQYDIGYWYIPVVVITILATTSAVAVTDGLDGLAGGTCVIAFGAYGVIAFLQEQAYLVTFCFTAVGALLGFLWYNAHPARVFMGDTGAMALGTGLATVALMTGHWLLLPIVGIAFVLEAASDVIQILYFKRTGGRRLFRMTPLHHHFELLGWSETQVVTRFWIIGIGGAMVGIALALQVN